MNWVHCSYSPRTRVCDAGDHNWGLNCTSWSSPTPFPCALITVHCAHGGWEENLSSRLIPLLSTPEPFSPFKLLHSSFHCALVLFFCLFLFTHFQCVSEGSVWRHWDLSRTKTELVGSLFLMFCISALPPIESPFSYSSHDSGWRNKANKTEPKPQLSRIYRALTAYQTSWTFFKACAGDSSQTTLLSPLHRLGYWLRHGYHTAGKWQPRFESQFQLTSLSPTTGLCRQAPW